MDSSLNDKIFLNIFKKREDRKMLKKKKKEKHYTYPVRDVSHYIIVYSNERDYGVSNLKLQKLLYFVQAFFLINDFPPCFDEKIEAWDFGPVVPEVYREYKRYGGMDIPTIDYYVKFDKKNIWNTERIYYDDIISDDDKEMIQAVVDKFAHCSATFLVNLTHNQDPWINAYVNGQRNEITKEDIKRYFDCKLCKYNDDKKTICSEDCSDAFIDGLIEIVKGGGVE